MRLSPDTRRLAIAEPDGWVRIRDVAALEQVSCELETGACSLMAWSPDGRRIATGDFSSRVLAVWDVTEQRKIWSVRIPLVSVEFDHQGKRLVVASTRVVSIFDAADGRLLRSIPIAAAGAKFSESDAEVLVMDARRTSLKVVDAGTGDELFSIGDARSSMTDFAISPQGRQIAVAAYPPARLLLYDLMERPQPVILPYRYRYSDRGISYSFSEDGRHVFLDTGTEKPTARHGPESRRATLSGRPRKSFGRR